MNLWLGSRHREVLSFSMTLWEKEKAVKSHLKIISVIAKSMLTNTEKRKTFYVVCLSLCFSYNCRHLHDFLPVAVRTRSIFFDISDERGLYSLDSIPTRAGFHHWRK